MSSFDFTPEEGHGLVDSSGIIKNLNLEIDQKENMHIKHPS